MAKDKQYDQPSSLMLEAIKLVKEIGVQEASFKTNLPFLWLQKLVIFHYKNPSVNRIEHIYTTLTGTKLIKD